MQSIYFLYRKTDDTEISLGLSSSDVNYLKDYSPTVLGDTCLENINTVQSDVADCSDIVTPIESNSADTSGDLRQQFSGLTIPDTNQSHENHFVQKSQANLVSLLDVPSVDENFPRGLKVVGTINVPLCSTISTTTLSYATSTDFVQMGTNMLQSDEQVRGHQSHGTCFCDSDFTNEYPSTAS